MRCPVCANDDTRVIDSRLSNSGDTVRRRRECQSCQARFNTLERLALEPPRVAKRDGSHEAFNEDKLRRGLERALEKRPVDARMLEVMVADLCRSVCSLCLRLSSVSGCRGVCRGNSATGGLAGCNNRGWTTLFDSHSV